jgi:predicted RNA methylase
MQLRFGLWEQETYKYIRRAAAEANWVINIGAGDGELSFLFATRAEADPIIAGEPGDTRLLEHNIKLSRSNRIVVLGQYLGTEANRVYLDSLEVPRSGSCETASK